MEKITIKKLAPYLPYELKVKIIDFNRNYTIGKIYKMSLQLLHDKFKANGNNDIFKPILRPLSDLRELGRDFDTEHSINMIIGENDNYGKVTLNHYKGKLSLEIEPSHPDYSKEEFVDFDLIEKIRDILLKNHYDIFGLIDEGLAIDINKL